MSNEMMLNILVRKSVLTLSLDPDVLTLITGTPLDLSITTVRSVPRLPTGRKELNLRNKKHPNEKYSTL